MANSIYRIEHLEEALQKSWVILSPNRRIAAKICQAWSLKNPNQVIANPKVYAVEG